MERSCKFSCSGDSQKYFLEVTLADLYILESALNHQKDYFVNVLNSRKGRKKEDRIFRSALRQHLAYMYNLYKDIVDFDAFIGSDRFENLKKYLVKK